MMYPITNRDVFSDVLRSFQMDRFIIHGPYQSGKTLFLWALDTELCEKTNIASMYFDMSGITGLIGTSDIRRTIKDKIKTDRNGLCTSWAIMMVDQMGKKGHTGFRFCEGLSPIWRPRGVFKYLSLRIFHEPLDDLELMTRL
jgi:hypothetical protein